MPRVLTSAIAIAGIVAVAAAPAHADVSIGAAVGAGAQGSATYSSLELRLDTRWQRARLGLGLRGVWDDARFRQAEWTSAWDGLRMVRDVGATTTVGEGDAATTLAIAAGALAPAHVGGLVEGYRAALDDRWRTGVRGVARSKQLEAAVEIDDVLDPALVAGSVRYLMAPPWGMQLALAVDPGRTTAFEAGAFRRFEGDRARADVGSSIVAELSTTSAPSGTLRGPAEPDLSMGAAVVAWGQAALERSDLRFTLRGDVRAGSGSVAPAVGALYRVERLAMDRTATGLGAGATLGASGALGWAELGMRARPALGNLFVAGAGAPMGRWLQAGMWTALGRDHAAGAAEVRVAWSRRLFSAVHAARLYRFDEMDARPIWSVTAWFGAASMP